MPNTDDLKRFMDDLSASEELRKKLDEAVKRIADTGTVESDGELMVAAAAELGYEFSVADLERASAEEEDLNDDDLAAVAAGVGNVQDEHGRDAWCFTAWHCFAVTMHTETKSKDVTCWSNYKCVGIHQD